MVQHFIVRNILNYSFYITVDSEDSLSIVLSEFHNFT